MVWKNYGKCFELVCIKYYINFLLMGDSVVSGIYSG